MADTTPANVRAIAKHLASVDDAALNLHIADAKLELKTHDIPEENEERLQRYLAAHYATLDQRRTTSERVGDIQASYQAAQGKDLDATEYGQEFKRQLRRFTGIRMVVL